MVTVSANVAKAIGLLFVVLASTLFGLGKITSEQLAMILAALAAPSALVTAPPKDP